MRVGRIPKIKEPVGPLNKVQKLFGRVCRQSRLETSRVGTMTRVVTIQPHPLHNPPHDRPLQTDL